MLPKRLMLLSTFLILITSIVNANTPKITKAIPLIPDSVRHEEGNETGEEAIDDSQDLISFQHAYYSVELPIKDVFDFYCEKLNATVEADEYHRLQLSNGESSPVFYRLEFYNLENIFEKVEPSGETIKSTLKKYTRPFRNGKWVKLVLFSWESLENDSSYMEHYISLWDLGLSTDGKSYRKLTGITVTTKTFKSLERRANSIKCKMKSSLRYTYPNTLYLGNLSAFCSIPGSSNYIFKTNDSIDEVVKFYESETGKNAVKGSNSYSILIHDGLSIDIYHNPENRRETMITISACD